MNQLMQDIQQIRGICQQLSQNERQNAQLFSQQPGMQAIAQRESFAANQLQQCVNLCNRLEQNVTRMTLQPMMMQQQFQPFGSQQFGGR